MASQEIAAFLRSPRTISEVRRILVGLGDNVLQAPRARVRRSAPAIPRGLFLDDGGHPGMTFRKISFHPTLPVSDELIRFVMGPGAVVDRPAGWEVYSGRVAFDRKTAGREEAFNLHHLCIFLVLAGGTALAFLALKRFLAQRQRRLRGQDLGPGGPGAEGPGPSSGGWRFAPALGLINLVGASFAGPCGRGGRRFARSLGVLELLMGREDGGGLDSIGGGGGIELIREETSVPNIGQLNMLNMLMYLVPGWEETCGPNVGQLNMLDMLMYLDPGREETCGPNVGQLNMLNMAGVRNTAFVQNSIPFVSEVPTVIFGADVTQPPPAEINMCIQELLHAIHTMQSTKVPKTADEAVFSRAGDAEVIVDPPMGNCHSNAMWTSVPTLQDCRG